MYRFEVIYNEYSACCDDFFSGIDYLKQRSLVQAIAHFQRAYESVTDQHRHRPMYLCYYGYARILTGDYRSIELCRYAARGMQSNADLYYILARAEMFCNNRGQMVRAITRGMDIDARHRGLRLMRKKTGCRRFTPVPFLHRNHLVNRCIGRLMRRRRF